MSGETVLVGTIGSDSHAIGQWVLAKFLEEQGYNPIKLGVAVSQQEFVDAVIETNADAVFVSSVYGMGYTDSVGLRDRLIEAGRADILLYVGGLLSVSSGVTDARPADQVQHALDQWQHIVSKFTEIGFDRVYPPDVKLDDVIADLELDLAAKHTKTPAD